MLGSLLAAAMSQIVLVVSGVIVARSLGPEDRGYLALLVLVPLMLSQAGSIGLPLASTYFIARFPTSARPLVRSLFAPAVIQLTAVVLLQAILLWLLVWDDPARVRIGAVISLAYPLALLAQQYGIAILQGQRRFLAFNVLRVAPSALYAVAVVALLLFRLDELVPIIAVAVGTATIAGAATLLVVAHGLIGRSDEADVPSRSEIARFGLKGFLGSMSPIENFRLDQAAIALFLNPVALGLYVVAQSLINLPAFISQSIGMVTYPQVASAPTASAGRRAIWRHLVLALLICGLVVVALEAVTESLIEFFFGEEFSKATPIAQILLVGALFLSGRRVLSDGARGAGRPGLGTLAEAASWISLIPALALFVPRYGAEGVALALTLSWGVSFLVLLAWLVRPELPRSVPTPWRAVPPALALATSLAAAAAVALLPPTLSLLVLLLLFGGLTGALVRRRVALAVRDRLVRHADRSSEATEPVAPSGAEPIPNLRFPRALYYGGLLFIGQLTIRPFLTLTLSDWLFFACLLTTCAVLLVHRSQVWVPLPRLLLFGVLLFAAGGVLSSFSSDAPMESVGVIVRIVYLTVVWFWLGTVVLQKMEHVRKAALFWMISVAVAGAGAVAQQFDPEIIPGGKVEWGRATGFTENMNDLGGLTSAAFVPALMLFMTRGRSVGRDALRALLLVLVAAGLLLSGSVGSLIAAAVATGVWLTWQHMSGRQIVRLAILGAGVLAFFALGNRGSQRSG
jgi:O-antigen/teichoic acid export membrane protein